MDKYDYIKVKDFGLEKYHKTNSKTTGKLEKICLQYIGQKANFLGGNLQII